MCKRNEKKRLALKYIRKEKKTKHCRRKENKIIGSPRERENIKGSNLKESKIVALKFASSQYEILCSFNHL
jgi:hypothetical protein